MARSSLKGRIGAVGAEILTVGLRTADALAATLSGASTRIHSRLSSVNERIHLNASLRAVT